MKPVAKGNRIQCLRPGSQAPSSEGNDIEASPAVGGHAHEDGCRKLLECVRPVHVGHVEGERPGGQLGLPGGEIADCDQRLCDAVRLLFRDSAFIYFFEPVDSLTSEVIIDSVSSACVSGVRLTRKGKLR